MDVDNLVRMANRIGQFFAAMPERTEALQGIAQHIQRLWGRRMRGALLGHLDTRQVEVLYPIVLDPGRQHRDLLRFQYP